MILDWHAHIYTPEEAADDLRTWDGNTGPSWGERGCPMVLENFVRAHKENNIDISVVSNAAHYLKGKRDEEELASVQAWSDYAEALRANAKQLSALAAESAKAPAAATPVDRIALQEKSLTARLEIVRRTKPALTALYAVLADDQKK